LAQQWSEYLYRLHCLKFLRETWFIL